MIVEVTHRQELAKIVAYFLANSILDFSDNGVDTREEALNATTSRWYVYVSGGKAAAIACVVDSTLLWLETLPKYQNRGYATELLAHIEANSLRVQATVEAAGFYRKLGVEVCTNS
jgi:GNAT superfamily N-acetyltransferase